MLSSTTTLEAKARQLSRLRGLFLVLALALGVIAAPGIAGAQTAPAQEGQAQVPPMVVAVDNRAESSADIVLRSASAPAGPQVTVNGAPAQVVGVKPAGESQARVNTVFVVDNSEDGGRTALAAYKTAAEAVIAKAMPGESVAVVSLGGTASVEVGLTKNTAQVTQVLKGLAAAGGTELWSGISLAADMLDNELDAVNNIVVLSASPDSGLNATARTALSKAISARAAVHVVSVRTERVSEEQVQNLATISQRTGGLMQTTGQAAQASTLVAAAGNAVRSLYVVTISSDGLAKGGNIAMLANGQQLEVGFIPGAVTRGAGLAPYQVSEPPLPFLRTELGKLLSLVMMFAAVSLGAYAIASLVTGSREGLNSVLMPYSGDEAVESDRSSAGAIFQRAVEMTGKVAERRGALQTVEDKLERADLPLRAAEALTGYLGMVAFVLVGSFVLTRSLMMTLIYTAVAALIPSFFLNFKAKRRKKRFTAQLPDTLSLLAGTLKAGYSFMQGVEAVAQEVENPMGAELRRVITEAQLGRPVEEALESAAARMNSEDFAWAVMAVRIQREVGGNLAELLLTVADTMTQRERLRGEVSALTAEGRMSAIVLGILPPGLGVVMYVINKSYMNVLFTDSMGTVMLVAAAVAMLIGFAWMKKIIDIRI
jgi:tight adherence protein B